jgi:hypothetical protein
VLLQIALEDSLVTMSTILSSRFVAGIRPDVEKVERQLTSFSDTLDQWVQVKQAPVIMSTGLAFSIRSSRDSADALSAAFICLPVAVHVFMHFWVLTTYDLQLHLM